MAKIYKLKIKAKNIIFFNNNVYYADNEYELIMTDKQIVAYKPFMEILSHSLIGEETEKTETDSIRKGRPPKRG